MPVALHIYPNWRRAPRARVMSPYAEIIRDRSVLRQLIRIAGEMSENARKPAGRSVSEILDEAETKVFKISEERPTRGGPEAVNHYLEATLDKDRRTLCVRFRSHWGIYRI